MRTSFLTALALASTIGLAGCETQKPSRHYQDSLFSQNNGPASEFLPGWGGLATDSEDSVKFSRHHRGNTRHVLGAHPKKHGAELLKRHKTESWFPTFAQVKAILKCMSKCTKK